MLKLGSSKSIGMSRWADADTKVIDIASKNPVTCMIGQKVKEVEHILNTRYRRLPVLDREGRVRGVISSTDVLKLLLSVGRRKSREPKDILETKVREVMCPHVIDIDINMPLADALAFFRKHRKGAYPVMHRKKLVGVVSEWDIVRQVRGKTGIKVSDIMVRRPLVARDNHPISDVAKMLCVGGFRRLPVVKSGILIGVITPRDILSYLYENGIHHKLSGLRFPVRNLLRDVPVAIGPEDDVYEAVKIMVSRKIGGLPVAEGHQLTGILTERDIVDVARF